MEVVEEWIPPNQEEKQMGGEIRLEGAGPYVRLPSDEGLGCAEELLRIICDKVKIKHDDMLSRIEDSKVSNEWTELISIVRVGEAYLTERERNNDANKS